MTHYGDDPFTLPEHRANAGLGRPGGGWPGAQPYADQPYGHQPYPGPPNAALQAHTFADITRLDVGAEAVAILLLVIALFLPWNRDFRVSSGNTLMTIAVVLATVISICSLTIGYFARLGALGSRWSLGQVRLLRLLVNVPYFTVLMGFLAYDIARGFARFGSSYSVSDFPGIGVGTWFGAAGVVLAAGPRSADRSSTPPQWTRAALNIMRVAVGLCVVSALVNIVAATGVGHGADVAQLKYAAPVVAVTLTAAAVVALGALGLSRRPRSWQLATAALAGTAMLMGLFLSFGAHVGGDSGSIGGSHGGSSPASVVAGAPSSSAKPVLVVLDTSSSMSDTATDGRTRIAAARSAVDSLINDLSSNRQFGLLQFPAGSGSDNDGCSTGDMLIPIQRIDKSSALRIVDNVEPGGDTPTAPALKNAAQQLKMHGGDGVIVLVSDGEANCGGDSCEAAQELTNEGLHIEINTVGMQISAEGQQQLQCIAQATGGTYVPATNTAELSDAISKLSVGSGENVRAPWLELFHGGVGYFAFLLWIAAAAASWNGHVVRDRTPAPTAAASGWDWLEAARGLLVAMCVWCVGAGVAQALALGLDISSRTSATSAAVFWILSGIVAGVGASSLRPVRTPGLDPRPGRLVALLACGGITILTVARLVAAKIGHDATPVDVVDLITAALPVVLIAALGSAPAIRALYAGRPLIPGARQASGFAPPPSAPVYRPDGFTHTAQSPALMPVPARNHAVQPMPTPAPSTPIPTLAGPYDPGAAAVADPATSAEQLYHLATDRPELRAAIAAHPHAYDGLLTWLAARGDPAVNEVIARRSDRS